MRVLAAMSGGVDSSVAAARAVDAGYEVVGVHLALSRMPGTIRTGSRGCCTIEDALDARRVADSLGIPFYVWDFSERFKSDVVDDFVSEYQAGRTPNPCMRCNERIKFAALLEKALALGFDCLVTGHYARVVETPQGPELHRAQAWAKDQSYVLGVLTAEQLEHAWFPLGDAASKTDIRAEAAERGFITAAKPDSYDICFIPDGDTRGWLADRLGEHPGDIVDRDGTVVGTHTGTQGYTVGQRRGLHLGRPAPDGRPRFVLEVKPATNQVVVGPKAALAIAEIAGSRYSWAGPAPEWVTSGRKAAPQPSTVNGGGAAFDSVDEGGSLQEAHGTRGAACQVQLRAHADPVPAHARVDGEELVICLDKPALGIAPGQTAVLYQGTRVLGQTTIDRTVSAVPAPTAEVPATAVAAA